MGYGHPLALRSRIIDAVNAGAAAREAARRFMVSPSSAINLVRRWRETGSFAPGRIGGQKKRKLAGRQDWLHAVMASEPDITLAELKKRLAVAGIDISQQAINTTLRALWVTAIKKTQRAAEQDRTDVAQKREQWIRGQSWLKPERLVFIDETGAKTNMARLRGR